MKIHFVGFYSEGTPHDKGINLNKEKNIIINELKNEVDSYSFYTPKKILDMGYDKHMIDFNNAGVVSMNPGMNHIGNCAWRPLIILLELQKLNNNDIVVYRDINCTKYPDLKNFKNFKNKVNNILTDVNYDFAIPRHSTNEKIIEHCKTNIIKDLAINQEFTSEFPLLISTYLIFKKTNNSIQFLNEWNDACLIRKYIDGEIYGEMSPKFKWSTPEQSIMSVIISNWVYEQKNDIPLKYPNFMINNKTRDFYNYLYSTNYEYLKLIKYNIEGFSSTNNYNNISYIILILLCVISIIITNKSYLQVYFCLIIIYTIFSNKIYENYENINMDIGNMLSEYYSNLVISILNKKDFIYKNDFYVNNATVVNEKNEFLNNFPQFIKFNNELYNEFLKNNITANDITTHQGFGFWKITDIKHEKIHKIMKPTVNKILNDVFIKLNLKKEVKYPVIHFRCADTPFNKWPSYTFQKYSFFDRALNDIKNKIGDFKNITILACFDHLSNNKNKDSCNNYIHKLKDSLNNYEINIECNSNVDDFVTLFYAPAVISTLSSFSFMSGYFGNGIYIQPNMLSEDNIEFCDNCELNYSGYNIPHNKVDDYHNVDEVYKLLIE